MRIGSDGSRTPVARSPFWRFIQPSASIPVWSSLLTRRPGDRRETYNGRDFPRGRCGRLNPIVMPVRSASGNNGVLLGPNTSNIRPIKGFAHAGGDTVAVFRVTDGGLSTVSGSPFRLAARRRSAWRSSSAVSADGRPPGSRVDSIDRRFYDRSWRVACGDARFAVPGPRIEPGELGDVPACSLRDGSERSVNARPRRIAGYGAGVWIACAREDPASASSRNQNPSRG